MLARRIVAKHVTKTTVLAMVGATAVLSILQILFTYLGELSSLKDNYTAWNALQYVLWGAPRSYCSFDWCRFGFRLYGIK